MVKRRLYMEQIRPFINRDIVKVITGIRRCGKSVMLQLIREELLEQGIEESRILQVNFETKAVDYVRTTEAAYSFIKGFAGKNKWKVYLLLD